MPMPKVKLTDIAMYYETQGQGEPIVFLAGFSCDHTMWAEVTPHLAGHQVILVDNRGVGQTDAPAEAYSIEQMAKDTVLLCDHLGVQQAHFVGNSMGGFLVQQISYQYPERVKTATISNSATSAHVSFQIYLQAQLEMIKAETPLATLIKAACSWVYSHRFLSQGDTLNKLIQMGIDNPYPFTISGYEGQLAALNQFDSSQWVDKIAAPTLVVGGNQDLVFNEKVVQQLSQLIPQASYYGFKECGHLPPIEYPEQFASILSEFIAKNIYKN